MAERVQVVVRIRPFIDSDPSDAELNTIVLDDTHISVGHHHVFKVDRVFMMEDESDVVYRERVAPLVDRFMGGCNASVLAYGQTGTGKTYTVQAVLPLLLSQMLASPNPDDDARPLRTDNSAGAAPPPLQLQYVEVYGETIRDLLADPTTRADPRKPNPLRLVTTTATGVSPNAKRPERASDRSGSPSGTSAPPASSVVVAGATVAPVYTVKDAAALVALGDARRATGATNIHAHSSRSHAILTFFHPRYACRLDVVDLAGSEREKKTGNTGLRFQESIAINTGLLALGNVIRALARNHRTAVLKDAEGGSPRRNSNQHLRNDVAFAGNGVRDRRTPTPTGQRATVAAVAPSHVPYRSSKLTRLLQDTLGGSSATLFIACVAPDTYNRDETLRTLQYCSLALQVLNDPIRQYDRLQRAQSRGRHRQPQEQQHQQRIHGAFPDVDSTGEGEGSYSGVTTARVAELQTAYALLQRQYDEQSEVLASMCESYTEAKERLELWETELRTDERLFTQQIRAMQELVQENQRLRHRLGKMKVMGATGQREGLADRRHRDAAAPIKSSSHEIQRAVRTEVGDTAGGYGELHDDAAALLRDLLYRNATAPSADERVTLHPDTPSASEAGEEEATTAAVTVATAADVPAPPVSALSPYRHLSFTSGSVLQDSVSSHPGNATFAATSEPVQSFIRSLLRQHGIFTAKEKADPIAKAVVSPPFDAVSPTSSAADAGVTMQAPRATQSAVAPRTTSVPPPETNETSATAPAAVAPHPPHESGRNGLPEKHVSALVPHEPQRDAQLLQLAQVVLRYEETNTDLRNQVRLLQARLDDKSREAARLRLEVQDVKDIYSSLSAMTE